MTSPVCKCAVPMRIETGDYLGLKCGRCNRVILPKEVKCKSSPYCSHNTNGRDLDKPCSISPNMTEVMEKVDKQIGGAVRRLGSEGYEHLTDGKIPLSQEIMDREVMPHLEAPNTEASWEYGFDEKFDSRFYGNPKKVAMNPDEVKSFIRSLLISEKNKAREETLEEVHDKIITLISERQKMNPVPSTPISDALNIILEAARGGKV